MIRPLGRPDAEHLGGTGSADDLAAEWRLGRAPPAREAAQDEPLDGGP